MLWPSGWDGWGGVWGVVDHRTGGRWTIDSGIDSWSLVCLDSHGANKAQPGTSVKAQLTVPGHTVQYVFLPSYSISQLTGR